MPVQRLEESRAPATDSVVVFHGDETEGVPQPSDFHCCAHGVRLVNRRPVPRYELVEFMLDFPAQDGSPPQRIACVGVVADCRREPDRELYCIDVRFLDLPASARRRLASLTPPRDHRSCPCCENC